MASSIGRASALVNHLHPLASVPSSRPVMPNSQQLEQQPCKCSSQCSITNRCEPCCCASLVVRVVHVSDTHNLLSEINLPAGDVLIHSGDFTDRATPEEMTAFDEVLASLPFAHKVVVNGNHDLVENDEWNDHWRERLPFCAATGTVHFPRFETVELEFDGAARPLRVFGFPWLPLHSWSGRLRNPSEEARELERSCFARVAAAEDVDILISHLPPAQYGDATNANMYAGSRELLSAIQSMRPRPRAHLFGHVHEAHGWNAHSEFDVVFVNSAACTRLGHPSQPPHILDFELPKVCVG